MVYLLDRWYDPKATVWIQADPSRFTAGDTNLTRYVGNNVTNAVDPSGLIEIDMPAVQGEAGKAPRNPAIKAVFGVQNKRWKWGPRDGMFISQRVTNEGTLTVVDGCGDTHSVSWRETYVEVWPFGGNNSENHTAATRKAANYLAKLGNFRFAAPRGSGNALTINYSDHSCDVRSWQFQMRATYEVTSGNYGLDNTGFYKSENHFLITQAAVAGRVVPNPQPLTNVFDSMQYPHGTLVKGLAYPPPQPQNAAELTKNVLPLVPGVQTTGQFFAADRREFEDVDTWDVSWTRGDKEAQTRYTSTGYQQKP